VRIGACGPPSAALLVLTSVTPGTEPSRSRPALVKSVALDDGARPSIDHLVANFASILNSRVALYYQPDGRGQPLPVISSWGLGPHHEQITRSLEGGVVGRALGAKRAALEPLALDSVFVGSKRKRLTHAVAAPVRVGDRVAGALVAAFSAPPADEALTLWATESCAAMIALCLHEPRALADLIQRGGHDALTGCLNHAAIRRELDREINRSGRANVPLSLCFIDLDHFTQLNDLHGHLLGNEVLAQVAHILRTGVRTCDTVGRFGADEFVAILPETTLDRALELAERLRSRIADASVASPTGPLSASIGTAQWIPDTSAEELLIQADDALMIAKARAPASVSLNGGRALQPVD
jgi:diguanylate cyclase (GGDEF)-like protein